MTHKIQIITIVENSPITGIRYGTKTISLKPDTSKMYAKYNNSQKIRGAMAHKMIIRTR